MDMNESRRLIRNLIRKGHILAVDHAHALCRVAVGDTQRDDEGLKTNWLPWLAATAGTTREWLPPTQGEQVLLLCPTGDPAQGVVLRGLYSDDAPSPSRDDRAHVRVYPDGARIAYHHQSHQLDVVLPGGASINITAPDTVTITTSKAAINADDVTINAKQTTCNGGLLVKGPFAFESGISGKGGAGNAAMKIDGGAEFTKDVVAGGVSLIDHPHMAQGENAKTSKPIGGAA
ncbi:phage baseplate assembly protein V [Robbsia andropogonis]|uniref:phage baseplate assembly protein V n=1 Tax=Robbsia andropogonis TaxID=28092 RepID=UPI003D235E9A